MSATQAPPVSLLIPCFNAAKYLPRLADCVQALSTPFAEIICYDDGSSDNTINVAEALGWTILRGRQNAGVARARNALAAAASNEWIHYHDADDLIHPDMVLAMSAHCSARNDLVSCDADWIRDHDRALVIPLRYDPVSISSDPVRHLLTHPMGLNTTFIRKTLWSTVGGCNEQLKMWEDADVHIRLAHAGARCVHVPKVLSFSLRHDDSFSHDYRTSWNCRLHSLSSYRTWTDINNYRQPIAEQAERAAKELLRHKDVDSARRALKLCVELGGNPPTSKSRFMHLLKRFIPSLILLRLQETWRAHKASITSKE